MSAPVENRSLESEGLGVRTTDPRLQDQHSYLLGSVSFKSRKDNIHAQSGKSIIFGRHKKTQIEFVVLVAFWQDLSLWTRYRIVKST